MGGLLVCQTWSDCITFFDPIGTTISFHKRSDKAATIGRDDIMGGNPLQMFDPIYSRFSNTLSTLI